MEETNRLHARISFKGHATQYDAHAATQGTHNT